MKTPKQAAEERAASASRAKEARDRIEVAYRNLAANEYFKEYCIELKKEARAAIELATKEARKPAESRNNQHVIDKLREYDFKEEAASRVFDHLANIEKETTKKEAPKPSIP